MKASSPSSSASIPRRNTACKTETTMLGYIILSVNFTQSVAILSSKKVMTGDVLDNLCVFHTAGNMVDF